jgi:hypothetical protein
VSNIESDLRIEIIEKDKFDIELLLNKVSFRNHLKNQNFQKIESEKFADDLEFEYLDIDDEYLRQSREYLIKYYFN